MGRHKIEFVSYDGKYPVLCMGDLVVRIDGRLVRFCFGSWTEEKAAELNMPCYPYFWHSGGNRTFSDKGNVIIEEGPWEMDLEPHEKEKYPKDILELLPEILEVMNDNVPPGCCGGCL